MQIYGTRVATSGNERFGRALSMTGVWVRMYCVIVCVYVCVYVGVVTDVGHLCACIYCFTSKTSSVNGFLDACG